MGGGVAYARECVAPGRGESPPAPSVLIVMDASKSMGKPAGDGRSRLDVAKDALRTLIDGLPDGARVGLRLYGHRVSGAGRAAGCRDTSLVSPVAALRRDALRSAVASYEAVGSTPIGRALRAGASDLAGQGPRTIVLVSDGGDNCAPPDPCDVAGQLAASATNLSIQAIGFQVGARARRELRCIAGQGGGVYRDASDADELVVALRALAARGTRARRPAGRPIAGGATSSTAPEIASGRFVDRIAAGERRWYAVRLGRGQRLAAGVVVGTFCHRRIGIADMIGTALHVEVFDPAGEWPIQRSGEANLFFGDESSESGGILTPRIGAGDDSFARPGRYLLRIALTDNAAGSLARALAGEVPTLQIVANVDSAAATAAATVARAPAPAVRRSRTGAPRTPVVLAGLAIGFLVGLMAVLLLRRRHA